MTRVLVVAPRFAPAVGGLETYVGWLARTLRDEPGFEVSVLTTGTGRRDHHDVVDGIAVHRLAPLVTFSNTPVHPSWVWRVRRLVEAHRPDVVNAHAPVPGLADLAVLAGHGRPTVLTYHAGSMVKGGSWVDPLLRTYERSVLPRVLARSTSLVAVSQAALTWASGRATLIPPGVDTAVFTPPASGDARERRLVFAGRLEQSSRWKGVHVLLEALALVPGAVLDVAGDGDDVAWLRDRAAGSGVGDRVVWHGSLEQHELAQLHRRASVSVLPSLTESESFGMSLVEAMACGTAVVGSRVGGIPSVIDEGRNGLLATPGSPSELADAINRVLDEPALAARLGQEGRRQAVERFAWEHRRASTLGVLTEAAGSSLQRAPAVGSRRG